MTVILSFGGYDMLLGGITAAAVLASLVICTAAGGFAALQWLWILPVSFLGCWIVLAGLGFLTIFLILQRVDTTVPREEDSPFYRRLGILVADAVTTLLQMRIHTRGMEQLPKEGRYVLVCNHLDILDPVVLLHSFPKSQLAFISKKENKTMFMVGKLMHALMCQLIDRENDREALKTILKCIRILKEDKASIAVFPEGYISLESKLHHFRPGVFKIAQKAGVPIVVCTLTNTTKIFHNAARLRKTDVQLHLVGVVPGEALKGVTTVEISNRVYDMMARDLGPELVLEEEESNT